MTRKTILQPPGTFVPHAMRTIIKVEQEKLPLQRSIYRVFNHVCKHISLVQHKSLMDKGNPGSGVCRDCARAIQGRTLVRRGKEYRAKQKLMKEAEAAKTTQHSPWRNPSKDWADNKQHIQGDHNCGYYRKALAELGTTDDMDPRERVTLCNLKTKG